MKYNNTIVTPVLAAGSTASPYYYQVNVSQRLCSPSCAGLSPVFSPTFQVEGISPVGTNQYMVTINLQGTVSYAPCGGSSCCTKTQLISQSFALPISAASVPAVTLSAGTPVNVIAVDACEACSRQFVSEIPLSVTITTTE